MDVISKQDLETLRASGGKVQFTRRQLFSIKGKVAAEAMVRTAPGMRFKKVIVILGDVKAANEPMKGA